MTSRRTDVPTLLLLVAMYAILGGNITLYYLHGYRLPAAAHVLISAIAIHLAFTVWHEAVHGTASRSGRINNVVGVLGMLPYMTPYFIQRFVHLEHHRKLNLTEDPNFIYTDGTLLTLPFRYVRAVRYAQKILRVDPRSRGQRASDLTTTLLVGSICVAAALTGHLTDMLVLWLVPVVVAKLVMDWYINYLPHRGLPAHPYLGTRIIDVLWLTPLVLNHNYHAVHHLWPTVPWHRYRQVYRKKLDHLTQNGVPIEHRVFGSRP